MTDKEQIMINGVDILKEKINMCFILLLKNKLETPETIEQTIYEHLDAFVKEWNAQLARKTQECEKYKKRAVCFKDVNKQLGYKYLTIKQEYEELKKEIINKNEKIKELRFSVSDLTNRLCSLNAEKSFRIVDLEQTLDGIEKELKEDIYCENQECGCDDFEECLKCTKEHILEIINKAKGEE